MTNKISSDIAQWLPMAAPATLIDSVSDWGEDFVQCEVFHQRPNYFTLADGRIPSCVCLEYIAQSACVIDGIFRSRRALPPRLAFLLGTRKIAISKPYFYPNEVLSIYTRIIMQMEESTYVFSSDIRSASDNKLVVENAIVKAVAPEDPQQLIFQRVNTHE